MSVSPKIDAIDCKILEILQANGKITNSQLSKDIGLSPAPTLERVKKLEQADIIRSYHALVTPAEIGLGVSTFIQVTLLGHKKEFIDAFVSRIHEIPEIIECHHVTGQGDFLLKVVSTDIISYQKLLLEVISEIKEIASMQTIMILSTFKDSQSLPVPNMPMREKGAAKNEASTEHHG